jgi:GTPase involved in cell partitioning and DNA repair
MIVEIIIQELNMDYNKLNKKQKAPMLQEVTEVNEVQEKCAEILAKTEWIASSNISGVTREKWATYRQAITDIMNNPPTEGEVVYPQQPE